MGRTAFVLAALAVAAGLVVACVDGVTPDCSDVTACAPSIGDAAAAPLDADASDADVPDADGG